MPSPVFVHDAAGTPLMPTSAAYARRLLHRGKARWVPHHAFPIIQLSHVVTFPVFRPVVVGVSIHLHTAELVVVAGGVNSALPLLHIVVDLRTDIPVRLRRRAGHRRRRRAHGRYRPIRRHGQPFKLRRPSLARSAWGRVLRPRRRRHSSRLVTVSPTMRWRAQAITRVITALKPLLPLSHAVILSPANTGEHGSLGQSTAKLRQQLIAVYGQIAEDGRRIAMCAYCGTTEGHIEAEHILPLARNGTDGWNNRVLACATCNARKGNRTPEEANMPLIVKLTSEPQPGNRAGVYARWTARSLLVQLQPHIVVRWPNSADDWPTDIPADVFAVLNSADVEPSLPVIVAKPVGRPAKQVFSSRNYPLSTPLTTGFVHVKQAIKRRNRVNAGLAITNQAGRRQVQVLPAGVARKADSATVIAIGMLCEAKRNDETFVGIIAAIHSTGRLTIMVPETVHRDNIRWLRLVVSPRQHLRILNTNPVVFIHPLSGARDERSSL